MKTNEFKRPPKDQVRTILVSNCQECPFMWYDDSQGISSCTQNIKQIDIDGNLPDDKVHNKCPLKNMNYRIRLK